jgi:hypothetical protein
MKIKTCPDCNGDGVVDKDTDNERQCPTCGGLGFVPDDDDGHEEVIKTAKSPVGRRECARPGFGSNNREIPGSRGRIPPSPHILPIHDVGF